MTGGTARRWRGASLVLAFVACFAPLAHILEMPNKLRLEGGLWLGVQQHLYAGWGPLIGAPTEITGVVLNMALAFILRKDVTPARRHALAAICYAGMLVCFFLFNAPVNAAVSSWTADTLPPEWNRFRLRWEVGHGLAALLAVLALTAIATVGKRSGGAQGEQR